MSGDEVYAELVGGPCDGQSHWVCDTGGRIKMGTHVDGVTSTHVYLVRMSRGEPARPQSGKVIYDWDHSYYDEIHRHGTSST